MRHPVLWGPIRRLRVQDRGAGPGASSIDTLPSGPTPGSAFSSTVVDPIGGALAELQGGKPAGTPSGGATVAPDSKVVDPLADVMKDIQTEKAAAADAPKSCWTRLPT